MARYRCSHCNYTFNAKDEAPKMCPYCGKKGTTKKEPTSEKLISEVEDLMKEGKL